MSVGLQQPNPPYVTFESRAVEDRSRSQEEGRMIFKNVTYAFITPHGGRDTIEKIADDWIKQIRQQAMQGTYDQRWVDHYERAYDSYKKGEEMPEIGTPLKTCLIFSPAEIAQMLAANVRTLEDLAAASEEALGRIGMGAREWKKKAADAISASADSGKMVLRLNALEAEGAAKDERITKLEALLNEAIEKLAEDTPRRGRPPKSQTE